MLRKGFLETRPSECWKSGSTLGKDGGERALGQGDRLSKDQKTLKSISKSEISVQKVVVRAKSGTKPYSLRYWTEEVGLGGDEKSRAVSRAQCGAALAVKRWTGRGAWRLRGGGMRV